MIVDRKSPGRCLPTLAQASVIVVLGCAVYLPAIHGGWLHDDATFVGGDLASRSGSLGQMFRLWLDPDGVDYFPLTYTAFWIQYAFFGLNTTGYNWRLDCGTFTWH